MMESLEEVLDSPTGWVARHVRRYVETDGRRSHKWYGVDTLLLITRGRRSGKLRPTAVIYGRDGGRYVLVASDGGASKHPSWYLNLGEYPQVWCRSAWISSPRERTATAEDKPRL
jgi:deazaflavin-dependent oxidoreductase (nitroreductase family)